MINDFQAKEIRLFWEELASNSAQFAELFYIHLFDKYPDLFAVFSSGLHKQQHTFIHMLGRLIENPNNPKTLTLLRAIGLRHERLGILPAHYPFIREALLKALSEAKPLEWTPEIERAWIHLCMQVEEAMTTR
jgi:hemoglobin-like flavoprotein